MEKDPHIPAFSLQRVLRELKDRKIRQRLAIYISAALTILGVVELFSNEYKLPRTLFDVALILLLCGLPCAMLSAWLHGVTGAQRIRGIEIGTYFVFGALAAGIIAWTGGKLPRGVTFGQSKSIAVLPFVNMSDSKDDEYFSDGVTEDILTQLSRIADLKVISRTSSMQYKNSKKSLRDISADLGVAYVLEGSVRRAGDRIRIVAQLIKSANDEHVWSETYDRRAEDVFAIQSEVAQNIAHELRAALSPAEIDRLEQKNRTNIEAYGFYLRGRDYYYRYTKEDNERAIEMFRSALRIDSQYAPAYAGIGDAFGMRATRYRMGQEWTDSAVASSTTAIRLDPSAAEGYKALGLALDAKGELRSALTQYYKAVELNPNYAPVLGNIGSAEFTLGHFDQALTWVKKAVALQPESAHYHTLVGLQYFSMGLDSCASVWLHRAMVLQPDMSFPNILLTYIDVYQGRVAEARERIGNLLGVHPGEYGVLEAAGDVELIAGEYEKAAEFYRSACARSGVESPPGLKLSFALSRGRRDDEAKGNLQKIIAAFEQTDIPYAEGSQVPFLLAEAYAFRGDSGNATRWLQYAIDHGFRDYRWLSVDPLLKSILPKPNVAGIVGALRSDWDAMRLRVSSRESCF